jgi:hypothetical protein
MHSVSILRCFRLCSDLLPRCLRLYYVLNISVCGCITFYYLNVWGCILFHYSGVSGCILFYNLGVWGYTMFETSVFEAILCFKHQCLRLYFILLPQCLKLNYVLNLSIWGCIVSSQFDDADSNSQHSMENDKWLVNNEFKRMCNKVDVAWNEVLFACCLNKNRMPSTTTAYHMVEVSHRKFMDTMQHFTVKFVWIKLLGILVWLYSVDIWLYCDCFIWVYFVLCFNLYCGGFKLFCNVLMWMCGFCNVRVCVFMKVL